MYSAKDATMLVSQNVANGEGTDRKEIVLNSSSLKLSARDDGRDSSILSDSDEEIFRINSKSLKQKSTRNDNDCGDSTNKSQSPPNGKRRNIAESNDSNPHEANEFGESSSERNESTAVRSETNCVKPKSKPGDIQTEWRTEESPDPENELNSKDFGTEGMVIGTRDEVKETSESEEEIFVKSKKNKVFNKSFMDSDFENSVDESENDFEKLDYTNDMSQSKKTKIFKAINSDDEEINDPTPNFTEKNKTGSSRIKNRRTTMTEKFKKRFVKNTIASDLSDSDCSDSEKSHDTDLKQLESVGSIPASFRKSNISNLYDSESSDDEAVKKESYSDERGCHEETDSKKKNLENTVAKKKKDSIIDQKTQRMSAKQATEQMKMIKSESGRMLREKQVELPYHRPKRITLKDILDRRKVTEATGDRRLKLRMTQQQLKEYAKQLEDREKDMIELCKSESEEEEVSNPSAENDPVNDPGNLDSGAPTDVPAVTDSCLSQSDHFDKEKKDTGTPEQGNSEVAAIADNVNSDDASTDKCREIILHDSQDTEDLFNSTSYSKNVNEKVHNDYLTAASVEASHTIIDIENKIENGCLEMTDSNTNMKMSEIDSSVKNDSEIIIPDQGSDITNNAAAEERFNVNELESSDIVQFEESELFLKYKSPVDQQQILPSQKIKCDLSGMKPKLTGSPGFIIDFSSGDVKESGIESLKRRFLIHSAMKTPLDMERGKEKKIRPGAQLSQLKRELEDQISERRSREWAERLEEDNRKKLELKELNGGDISDCEDLLGDETDKYYPQQLKKDKSKESDKNSSESELEEEEEENDVIIKDKKLKDDFGFIDGEAELDDENDSSDENDCSDEDSDSESDDQLLNDPSTAKKTRILKPFQDSSSSDEETITDGVQIQPTEREKPVCDISMEELMTTPSKQRMYSNDMFSSQVIDKNESFSQDWDDRLPLGQKCEAPDNTPNFKKSEAGAGNGFGNTPSHNKGRSDLVNLVSPLIKSTAAQKVTSEDREVSAQRRTPNLLSLASPKALSPHAEGKWINLQKKLFMDSDGSQPQDSQELADLCSGKFPTEPESDIGEGVSMSGLCPGRAPVCGEELSQNTENELIELCTGKFIGINGEMQPTADANVQRSHFTNSPMATEKISLTWSEPIEMKGIADLAGESQLPTSDSVLLASPTENVQNTLPDGISQCTIESNTGLKTVKKVGHVANKKKVNTIQSFFRPESKKPIDSPAIPDAIRDISESAEPLLFKGKYIISSSSDEADLVDGSPIVKKKALKSKKYRNKRRARPLQISDDDDDDNDDDDGDDEDEADNEVMISDLSNADIDDNEDRQVDYDSEENEIQTEAAPMRSPPRTKKAKTSEFFDNEAELTSEDEWKGSGDEDERGLDVLEWEEGDADRFDQKVVKDQLEKIHMREVLDQDKREVRLLQEMLLEDGDLEGGTRERKFRWKNVDSGIESGAMVGDDEADGIAEDFQSEEQWRRQRHERETYLRQMEKENGVNHDHSRFPQENDAHSETGVGMSRVKSAFEKANADGRKNVAGEQLDLKNSKTTKDLPSPIKKPFALQNNVRGTFLSRGQAALHRLALLTKNGGGADGDRPKNLSSLAPGKKGNFVFAAVSPPCRETADEEVKLAKRKAACDFSTPTLIKKIRVSEGSASNSKKSLFDHME